MGRVTRRPRAREDLIEIWTYIADQDDAAADKLIERIEATIVLLAGRPRAGRERPELAEGLRSFALGNHVIFYRLIRSGIDLVRVRSRYRDLTPEEFPD